MYKSASAFYAHMYLGFPQHSRIASEMKMSEKIRALMNRLNVKQGPMAELLDTSQPNVNRWLAGSEPTGSVRDRINNLYDKTFNKNGETIRHVKLMGYVGAGAEIMPEWEQVPDEGLDQVEVNFPIPDGLICFLVRGDSMLPQFRDGTGIVVWAEQRRPLDAFYGQEAIVRTASGRRYIKTIMRGTEGVNLVSWNAAPIENQHLEWIGEIYVILPPGFSHRF